MDKLLPPISLDASGLLLLADLSTLAERTALSGTTNWLEALLLCPGMHRQQSAAVALNSAEYPATAALTTGYVFRVENQATVYYLQRVGSTGCLTTLQVSSAPSASPTWPALLLDCLVAALTISTFALPVLLNDLPGLFILSAILLSRLLNIFVIRQRAAGGAGWKGAGEPGVNGSLLILLSQDRWIRLSGLVDDLKRITSGQWLRDASFSEECATSAATLLVYLAAGLAGNARWEGQVALLGLLVLSAAVLAVRNQLAGGELRMHGCVVRREGVVRYKRRLDMVEQLIQETGRDDWALRLGMIVEEASTGGKTKTQGQADRRELVTM